MPVFTKETWWMRGETNMGIGVYDHSKNKGFTGKKHSPRSKMMMSEGHRVRHEKRREQGTSGYKKKI